MFMLLRVGGDLFAKGFGDPPFEVLALPGWMRTVADYDQTLRDFAALAIDLSGFGGDQPPPSSAWSTVQYAEALLPALEAFATPPVLVGHSFGGRVALQLATMRPHALKALVLTGVPELIAHDKSRPTLVHRSIRALHRQGLVSDARLELWKVQHGSADYRNAEGVMRDILVKAVSENYEGQLRSLSVPTTFIWGENDTAAPLTDVERALKLVPPETASLQVLKGVGHFTPLEAPDAVASVIRGWLAA
jgi:pimeloyl-ACP methyl ester carboxylesterase